MGGDQLVAAVAGDEVERRAGDAVRAAEKDIYMDLIDEVSPLPGARELLRALAEGGRRVVLASSAKAEEADRYVDALGARGVVTGWTTSADVERTKPAPHLVRAALERLGGRPAVMIGDTTWDCIAAARAGLPTVCLLTGGFGADELRAAGAAAVYEGPRELIGRLGDPPSAAAPPAA
jgi:HAD superfamily hydrolase (TIGR01509 family)